MKTFKTLVSMLWIGGWWFLVATAIMCWCEDGPMGDWQPRRLQFYSHLLFAILVPFALAVGLSAINNAINRAFLKAIAQQQK